MMAMSPFRILVGRERSNMQIANLIYSTMSSLHQNSGEKEADEAFYVSPPCFEEEEMKRLLQALRGEIKPYSADAGDFEVQHSWDCQGILEQRLLLIPKGLDTWNIIRDNCVAVADFFDALILQHQFFVDDDCCPQESYLVRSQNAVDAVAKKVIAASSDFRARIVSAMTASSHLPDEVQDELCRQPQQAVTVTNQSMSTIQTVVNQPVFPGITDLKGGNLLILVQYVRSMLQANLPLNVEDWNSDILFHFTQLWGYRHKKTTDTSKRLWIKMTPEKILSALEEFLPEQVNNRKTTLFKTYENNMQKHPLEFNFGNRSLQQEMKSFQDQMSILELFRLH